VRRNYSAETLEVILALAVIVLTVFLFIRSDELTVLFPIVFGLGALMCLVYALEGTLFDKARKVKKSRGILFALAGLLLAGLTFLSLKVVMG